MWGFHLITSPLPMIAPKVKLSQGDKKQSKKQFAWLTISSVLRGVVEDICALEGVRSQPLPNVYCSRARIQGLWCFSSGLWWQLHHGSWYSIPGQAGPGHLGRDSTWLVGLQAQSGQLNSLFLPPTFFLPCSDGEPWRGFFLVGTPSSMHILEQQQRVWGKSLSNMHPALSKYFLPWANHGSLSLFFQGLIGKQLTH